MSLLRVSLVLGGQPVLTVMQYFECCSILSYFPFPIPDPSGKEKFYAVIDPFLLLFRFIIIVTCVRYGEKFCMLSYPIKKLDDRLETVLLLIVMFETHQKKCVSTFYQFGNSVAQQ